MEQIEQGKMLEVEPSEPVVEAEIQDAMALSAEVLMRKYPGLFRFNNARNGYQENAEIALRFNSTEQVSKWRVAMKHMQEQGA